MNKKILIVSILAVFTLLTISFATAVSLNTVKTNDKKESPLYGIRTRRAIGERLGKIMNYIKTRFIGDRIFFLPFQRIRTIISEDYTMVSPPSMCTNFGMCSKFCGFK